MTPSIRSLSLALGACLLAPTPALAQVSTHRVGFTAEHAGRITGVQVQENRPFTPLRVNLDRITTTNTSTMGQRVLDEGFNGFGERGCIERASYVANLDVGAYNAQGGFAEGEIMAAEYVIPASAYPIKIEQINGLFATVGATVSTITEWSILVWDGPPNTGTLVAEYSSDGLILPHLVMPPGNGGTEIQVSVDPGDPDQIILTNSAGTNSFTVGFRIDEHNNQTQNPCLVPPPQNSNAFPTTDTNGLSSPTNNWLFAIDCGFLGGWNRFSQLGIFQPSGDWGIEAFWSSLSCGPGVGACCVDGDCTVTTEAACAGDYAGDGTTCDDVVCEQPTQACCFEETGGCVNLTVADCTLVGGVPGGEGTDCATHVCFPVGACCLPDGSCADGLSPDECAMLNGAFQGDGSTCATTTCPEPVGACSFSSGGCLSLTEGDCATAGGSWCGAGASCEDADMDGTPDDCESPCPADLAEPFGTLDFSDVLAFLSAFGAMDPAADFALPIGTFDFSDVLAFLGAFGDGCP
ncbi:MAG: GC-type dockerin domain-anchored protein [Phycisphaerales bacterium JB059]